MKADWLTVVAQNTPTLQALIVALFNRQQSKFKIVSWYVVPECTNQGLGQRLLAALEEWCQKQGIQTMTFEMRNGNVSYAPVTHVLQKQG
ncbi:MAG: GNAT family N-acetyltransferase [Candidatus Thiodiazotropha sp.]